MMSEENGFHSFLRVESLVPSQHNRLTTVCNLLVDLLADLQSIVQGGSSGISSGPPFLSSLQIHILPFLEIFLYHCHTSTCIEKSPSRGVLRTGLHLETLG